MQMGAVVDGHLMHEQSAAENGQSAPTDQASQA